MSANFGGPISVGYGSFGSNAFGGYGSITASSSFDLGDFHHHDSPDFSIHSGIGFGKFLLSMCELYDKKQFN